MLRLCNGVATCIRPRDDVYESVCRQRLLIQILAKEAAQQEARLGLVEIVQIFAQRRILDRRDGDRLVGARPGLFVPDQDFPGLPRSSVTLAAPYLQAASKLWASSIARNFEDALVKMVQRPSSSTWTSNRTSKLSAT